MVGNNMYNYSISKYEKHLSPFGKKVLEVFNGLRKLESERYRNTRPQNGTTEGTITQNKQLLNNSDTTYSILTAPHYQNNVYDQMIFLPSKDTNSNQDTVQDISKSTDLIRPIKQNINNENNLKTKNNIVHQTNIFPHDHSDFNVSVSLGENVFKPKLENNMNLHKDDANVTWDNMFDTEVIIMTDDVTDKIDKATKKNNEFSTAKADCQINIVKKRSKVNKQSLITDTTSKKIKKSKDNTKSRLRKQNYTITIKNWLNDIHYDNQLDVKTIEKENEAELKEGTVEKMGKNKIKKHVQAQLANKDGIMKFSLPKEKVPKQNKQPFQKVSEIKETAYEIVCVDENNIQKIAHLTPDVKNKELIAVLMYCNGFSQLNRQYTDDPCVPCGIMLHVDNIFYYYKSAQNDLQLHLIQLLEYNEVICYDGKSILIYLTNLFDVEEFKCNIIDAKIGGSLLEPDNPPEHFNELQKQLAVVPRNTITTECTLQKCAWYINLLKDCVGLMKPMLLDSSMWNIFINVEMRLLPVLAAVERRGLKVDVEKLKSMEDVMLTQIKQLEQECYKAAGKTFAINSAMQVSAILYDELQLDTKSNVKIRETICKGAKSTSETMLRSLVSVHPLPKLILEYRHLHKAHSTFLAGIAQHVHDGIVRPTWEQNAAATGRIASSNPNLQAIPKALFSLSVFSGASDVDGRLLNFRSVYVPREGYTFLAADYKNVECRVFAHAAADTALSALLADGQDLFRDLAAKWLNKSASEVTSEDRERTKRIVYASLYGAGARKLMDILGISYEQTLAVTASFHRTFPSLKSFGWSVASRCEQNDGTLSTVCGRVRRFKNISNSDFTLKSQAERQAVNFIIQGSAADLCKMAMVTTLERLRNPPENIQAHLVLQLHDELVWEVRHQDLNRAAAIIKEVMENCGRQCGMAVLLPVSLSAGSNWGEMTELTV